jgi:hypothetical protein
MAELDPTERIGASTFFQLPEKKSDLANGRRPSQFDWRENGSGVGKRRLVEAGKEKPCPKSVRGIKAVSLV